MRRPLLLYVANDAQFFLSHRLGVAFAARSAGYDVQLVCPDGPRVQTAREYGFGVNVVPFDRRSINPAAGLSTIAVLAATYRRLRPAVVHHMTIKPVIYGGIAARMVRTPRVINEIPGLGYVFLASGARASVLRGLVEGAYRVALGNPRSTTLFQNSDDARHFESRRLVAPGTFEIIGGSWIDVSDFAPTPLPEGTPLVVFPSRMLYDKGVEEFVEAVRSLKERGVSARFALVGDTDPGNPAAIPREALRAWHKAGTIEWWGYRPDMPAVLREASVVCLPSYREGSPRVLLEAACAGRPSVATDVAGCRDVVEHGKTGLLAPSRDSIALAHALEVLVRDPALRSEMGTRARQRFEARFWPERVASRTMQLYLPQNRAEHSSIADAL